MVVLPTLMAARAPLDSRNPAIELHIPELLVAIELPLAHGCEWGRSAGSEGLGSELFADAARRIVAIDLELRPLRALRVVDEDEMDELKRGTYASAYAGEVRMDPSTAPIVASSIKIAPDLSAVAAAFQGGSWPADAKAVMVADGVVILIDRPTRTLAGILVEEPGRRQRIYGMTLDVSELDPEARALVGSLYVDYVKAPTREAYDRLAARTLEALGHYAPAHTDALRRAAAYLSRDLAVHDATL